MIRSTQVNTIIKSYAKKKIVLLDLHILKLTENFTLSVTFYRNSQFIIRQLLLSNADRKERLSSEMNSPSLLLLANWQESSKSHHIAKFPTSLKVNQWDSCDGRMKDLSFVHLYFFISHMLNFRDFPHNQQNMGDTPPPPKTFMYQFFFFYLKFYFR